MKIAFLSYYNGIVNRGVETVVHELASRLSQNHELTVFQGGSGKDTIYKVREINVKTLSTSHFPLESRLFLDAKSQTIKKFTKEALKDLKKEKYDIVVAWNNGWQLLLCKIANVGKVIAVGESGIGWDDRIAMWSFPDCFIALTKFQQKWLEKNNPFVKVVTIPNGVAVEKFNKSGTKKELNLPDPIILSVAALTRAKRLDLAIKAVAKLEKGSLVLVGKGEEENYLKKLGDELLPGRFKIISANYNDMPDIYRTAELFTFPTVPTESFGVVLLEAMATNLPVVTNDDPIRREIVGDAGLFVDPTNTEHYTEILKKALEMNWENKPKVQAEKFSWEKIAKQYEELFLEVIK